MNLLCWKIWQRYWEEVLAKHLTKTDIEAILNIIAAFEGNTKLTWKNVCDECISIVGKKPTRQSLFANEAISSGCHYAVSQLMTLGMAKGISEKMGFQTHCRLLPFLKDPREEVIPAENA